MDSPSDPSSSSTTGSSPRSSTGRSPTKGSSGEGEKSESLRVMVYSWNTGGIKISDKTREEWQKANPGKKLDPTIPDYLDSITAEISETHPDVVVFATQNAVKPGDHLHSHSLKRAMLDIKENGKSKYSLLKKMTLVGTGSSGSIKKLGSSYGLRNSVYVRSGLLEPVEKAEKQLRKDIDKEDGRLTTASGQRHRSCGYGISLTRDGIASYVKVPGYGVMAFANCYIATDKDTMKATVSTVDRTKREATIRTNNKCINELIGELAGVTVGGEKVAFLILCGDLGYRVLPPQTPDGKELPIDYFARRLVNEKSNWKGAINSRTGEEEAMKIAIAQLQGHDELTNAMKPDAKDKLYSLGEGIRIRIEKPVYESKDKLPVLRKDYQPKKPVTKVTTTTIYGGPRFFPTCRLKKDRTPGEPLSFEKGPKGKFEISHSDYDGGRMSEYYPSWCNRILYMTSDGYQDKLECTDYRSFDFGNMRYSPQAGVEATFTLKPDDA